MNYVICTVLSFLCATGLANPVENYEADQPAAVRLYKGDNAPFSGALLNFETVKSYEKMRYDYEIWKKDYQNYGPINGVPQTAPSDRVAFTAMALVTGIAVGGAALGNASKEVQNIALATASLGIVTAIVILAW